MLHRNPNKRGSCHSTKRPNINISQHQSLQLLTPNKPKKLLFREKLNKLIELSSIYPQHRGMYGVFRFGDYIAKNSKILSIVMKVKVNSVDHNFRDREFKKVRRLKTNEMKGLPDPRNWWLIIDQRDQNRNKKREEINVEVNKNDEIKNDDDENNKFNKINEEENDINEVDQDLYFKDSIDDEKEKSSEKTNDSFLEKFDKDYDESEELEFSEIYDMDH